MLRAATAESPGVRSVARQFGSSSEASNWLREPGTLRCINAVVVESVDGAPRDRGLTTLVRKLWAQVPILLVNADRRYDEALLRRTHRCDCLGIRRGDTSSVASGTADFLSQARHRNRSILERALAAAHTLGLTRAEAEISSLLLCGASYEVLKSGFEYEALKSRLKRLREKTGAANHGELLQILYQTIL